MKDLTVKVTSFLANAQNDKSREPVIASLFCEAISLAVVILNEVKDLTVKVTRFLANAQNDRIKADCRASLAKTEGAGVFATSENSSSRPRRTHHRDPEKLVIASLFCEAI